MVEKGKVKFESYESTFESKNEERKEFLPPLYSIDEKWVQDYIDQFREEPSFF